MRDGILILGRADLRRFWPQARADVNAANLQQMTPLHLALARVWECKV